MADAAMRGRFGSRSRELVERYSVTACADGIVTACLSALGQHGQHGRHDAAAPRELTRSSHEGGT